MDRKRQVNSSCRGGRAGVRWSRRLLARHTGQTKAICTTFLEVDDVCVCVVVCVHDAPVTKARGAEVHLLLHKRARVDVMQ